MDKAKFYEHQYLSIREEIKEVKARIFRLAWLGLIGVPTIYLFADKYKITVVAMTLPVIICTLMLLFVSESMGVMRAGKYIRFCIEPKIFGSPNDAHQNQTSPAGPDTGKASDTKDEKTNTDKCSKEIGWESWLEERGEKGKANRRLVDRLLAIFFYSLFSFYYCVSGWLALKTANIHLGGTGAWLIGIFYVLLAIFFVWFLYWSYREGTTTETKCK